MGIILGIIAAAGIGLTAAGAIGQARAQNRQADAMEAAERARQQQARLEAQRARRQMVRESLRARALASATAHGQGAGAGSGLQGGYAQISGATSRSIVATNQNEALGNRVFEANIEAGQWASRANTWGAVGSLGGALLNNLGTIGRVFPGP